MSKLYLNHKLIRSFLNSFLTFKNMLLINEESFFSFSNYFFKLSINNYSTLSLLLHLKLLLMFKLFLLI